MRMNYSLSKVLFLAEKIKYVKKHHYYYRNNREGSIMNTLKREKSIDSYEKIIFEIKKFKNEYNWSLFEKSRIFLCENYFVSYLYKMKDQNFKREEVREFENELKESFFLIIVMLLCGIKSIKITF